MGTFAAALDKWQYRPTEKIRSAEPKVKAYPDMRLTTQHSASIEAAMEAEVDRICRERDPGSPEVVTGF